MRRTNKGIKKIRLKIIELRKAGKTYEQIRKELGVSHSTISKIVKGKNLARYCVKCGETNPDKLEEHHPDKINKPNYTITLCAGCHEVITRKQLRERFKKIKSKKNNFLKNEIKTPDISWFYKQSQIPAVLKKNEIKTPDISGFYKQSQKPAFSNIFDYQPQPVFNLHEEQSYSRLLILAAFIVFGEPIIDGINKYIKKKQEEAIKKKQEEVELKDKIKILSHSKQKILPTLWRHKIKLLNTSNFFVKVHLIVFYADYEKKRKVCEKLLLVPKLPPGRELEFVWNFNDIPIVATRAEINKYKIRVEKITRN